MTKAEAKVTDMHNMINKVKKSKEAIERIIADLPESEQYTALRKEAKKIISDITKWDEKMIQRKSQAYDDVENFPNKFTANYLFALNASESDIPKVNEAAKNRIKELNEEWKVLKQEIDKVYYNDLPGLNKKMWDAGVGALKVESKV